MRLIRILFAMLLDLLGVDVALDLGPIEVDEVPVGVERPRPRVCSRRASDRHRHHDATCYGPRSWIPPITPGWTGWGYLGTTCNGWYAWQCYACCAVVQRHVIQFIEPDSVSCCDCDWTPCAAMQGCVWDRRGTSLFNETWHRRCGKCHSRLPSFDTIPYGSECFCLRPDNWHPCEVAK